MFYFGVDFYPEQWPEDYWPEAARLMAEAHFNVVRLAEFAWARMEPAEGKFDFAWLDNAISLLADHGMKIVLGTPTASPPAWLMSGRPELFLTRQDGQRLNYGNRREYCPNNPLYHAYSRCIVEQMASRYGNHPDVIGWQVDNEFGERCYCPACAKAFHTWLSKRYHSLSNLNEKWGTAFWGHTYSEWEQIPAPISPGGSPNPGLALDFSRFCSDSYVAYQKMQIAVLREKCPTHFITHNFMGFKHDQIDTYDLARDLDLVSWDNYPRNQWSWEAEVDPGKIALSHDTMRGLKRQNYWVIEQQAGSGGWDLVSVPPRPGELRLWTYQSIAHGADGVLFFRWRSARYGTEQYWHGLVDQHGKPGRRYEEIRHMGEEVHLLAEGLAGSTIHAKVAMLHSYDSRFAFQIQANNPQFSYPNHFHQVYQVLYRRNVPVDVVEPAADLSSYKLVLCPALHVVSQAVAKNLERFVRSGGVLVITPRSGVKDETNAITDQPLPGLLAEVCGVVVEEYDSLPPTKTQLLEFTVAELRRERPPLAQVWCDILETCGAEVVACYTGEFYSGKPAITLNHYGLGVAIYVGTIGDDALYETLAGWLLDLAGVSPLLETPQGVEVTERRHGDGRILFVLNHTASEQRVILDGRYSSLLDDSGLPMRDILLPAYGVELLIPEHASYPNRFLSATIVDPGSIEGGAI